MYEDFLPERLAKIRTQKGVSAEKGEVLAAGSYTASPSLDRNPYTVLWSDALATENNTQNGVMLTLTFEILEGEEEGVTPITVAYSQNSTFDKDLEAVTFTTQDGEIEIINRIADDADGDGEITLKDIAVIRRYLTGWDGCSINDADAALIERYLAGWDVTLQ